MRRTEDFTYSDAKGHVSLWVGYEHLQFEASGNPNGIGAFSGKVQAPSHITVSKPPWEADQGPTIDRSKDLAVAWSTDEVASGKVQVVLSGASTERSYFLVCELPLSDSKGSIPASVLGKFPSGEADFGVYTTDQTHVAVPGSDWNISLELNTVGALTDGIAVGTAILQ